MDPIPGYDVILGVGCLFKGGEWLVLDECGGESVGGSRMRLNVYLNVLSLHQA